VDFLSTQHPSLILVQAVVVLVAAGWLVHSRPD
jgi:hypothetical protein